MLIASTLHYIAVEQAVIKTNLHWSIFLSRETVVSLIIISEPATPCATMALDTRLLLTSQDFKQYTVSAFQVLHRTLFSLRQFPMLVCLI